MGKTLPLVGPGSELQLTLDGGARPHLDIVAESGPEPSAAAAVLVAELVDAADLADALEVGEEQTGLELEPALARVDAREENLYLAGELLAAREASPATRRQYASIYRSFGGWLRGELDRPPMTKDLTADAIGAFARHLEARGGRGGRG